MGQVPTEQKHSDDIENGNQVDVKTGQNHPVDIVNFSIVRGTYPSLPFPEFRVDETDSEV